MLIQADLHCHSLASSHAYSTVDEMAAAARRYGLKAFALTDHAMSMPDAPHEWHFHNLHVLPQKINGVTVLRGAEANIKSFEGDIDMTEFDLSNLQWVVASCHVPVIKPGTEKENTAAYVNAVKDNTAIDVIGHCTVFRYPVDFEAIAKILEQDLGIPAFSVPTNGMHDYVYGVGMALAEIAKRIEGKREVTPKSVNLLGVTPLDFGPQEHVDALIQNVEQAGWKVLSTWAMGDTLENLARAPEAEVNLVVSSTGLRAAEILQERFGTPYVTGTPIRGFMEVLLHAMEEKKQVSYLEYEKRLRGFTRESGKRDTIILIGEPVIMKSLAAAIEIKYRINVKVICPLKETDGLLADGDVAVCGEEELEQALQSLKNVKGVVADPLYRPVCPENVAFYELPHIAFSGRIYKKKLPVLAELI